MSGHNKPAPATRAVRAGLNADAHHGAVIPPLHLSSTFRFRGFGEKGEYDYTRSGNPTRDLLARALAELEEGAGSVITSTGMSAITLVAHLLGPDDLLVAPHDCYGGTYRLLNALARKSHFRLAFIDQSDAAAVARALEQRPRMVWIETPSNPLLRIVDIRALAAQAHARDAIVVADNTFLSPALQRPLTLGADIVVHSTTKYLNGHSDIVGGAVVVRDVALLEELTWWANCLGLTGAPFDSFLTLRGVRTLHARMRAHLENADAIVDFLHGHPDVLQVYYPGLPTHRGHEIAKAQQSGFGAMISFELLGGATAVRAFVEGLEVFTLAESLGGVESLVAHPATMTHASMDAEARRVAGVSDGLLRLSVGIEDAGDLIRDLAAGLSRLRNEEGAAREGGLRLRELAVVDGDYAESGVRE
jgi:cystathionine gamma-synthase